MSLPRAHRLAFTGALAAGLICLACVVAACAGGAGSSAASAGAPRPAGRPAAGHPVAAQVTVIPGAVRTTVPRSFLGISTEYWALPQWAGEMPLLERVLSLVHTRGDGPLILRVGGDSADHSFWDPRDAPMPAWVFSLAPRWLRQARSLVRALRVRIILDLNLITDTPSEATQWARAAQAALPRGSIAAFEVGNEPDVYSRADWRAITADRRLAGRAIPGPTLPAALNARDYVRAFHAYAAALHQVDPHVMLGGPALANPLQHGRWVMTLIDRAHRSLGLVTIHRYPYSGCAGRRGTRSYATIGRLLSPAASTAMAAALRPLVNDAHEAGLALRLTELNSVNCGGRPGVSDAFATALWAPDALFALLRAGVNGVNLHVRSDAVNAAFALTPGGLEAHPLLYGLILFARTLGRHAQLVRLASHLRHPLNLAAWAVRAGRDTLHVLLIDKGRHPAHVALRLPATGAAGVQRLLAPTVTSQTGVTLAGRQLGSDGRWQSLPALQRLAPREGVYTISVRSMSAALVSVRIRPGALGVAPARGPRRRLAPGASIGARPPRGARSRAPGARSRHR